MLIKIQPTSKSETVAFAALELKKYLCRIDPANDYIVDPGDSFCERTVLVGPMDAPSLCEVEDKELDDAIAIEIDCLNGFITGTNDRAVLIAVYRFLRQLGCSFIRPGDDGETVPARPLANERVVLSEKPSYRHRAVCIEGQVSREHVLDFIEWLPKVGMNGFYNQFRVPFEFYYRWYSDKRPEIPFTVAEAGQIRDETVAAVKKRGLLYHAVGHGWTCEPFGIEGLGWFKQETPADDSVKRHLAMLDGKRDFFEGVALNTNLCYSSPEVQRIMTDAIVDYSQKHPEIDYMHVWLADGTNNQCECDECKKMRPADHYVTLLNSIDAALTEKGLATRIVFLIYVDLLWQPIKERLNHPDRFVLMFAPITRSYCADMASAPEFEGELPEYCRNKNMMPSSVSENIAHLKNWQSGFPCDSFDFDYHYMWDHFKDMGNLQIARVLFEDMKGLSRIGLNGMVSCQCIRSFFPHGLGMNAMAAALWDSSREFDGVADEYFTAAYGSIGKRTGEYFAMLSRLCDPAFLRCELEAGPHPELVAQLDECRTAVGDFIGYIENTPLPENETHALSRRYLVHQTRLALLYLDWAKALAACDREAVRPALEAVIGYSRRHEDELCRVLDHFELENTLTHHVTGRLLAQMPDKG